MTTRCGNTYTVTTYSNLQPLQSLLCILPQTSLSRHTSGNLQYVLDLWYVAVGYGCGELGLDIRCWCVVIIMVVMIFMTIGVVVLGWR